MTAHEQAVLAALEALEAEAAKARTGGAKGTVLPILEELDRLTASLPEEAPRDLRHYLQRKSYEKAREFLRAGGGVSQGGHGSRA